MIPDDYQSQCDRMREMLDDIASGDLAVPVPAGQTNLPTSTTLGQEKIFTRSKFDISGGELRNPDEGKSLDTV